MLRCPQIQCWSSRSARRHSLVASLLRATVGPKERLPPNSLILHTRTRNHACGTHPSTPSPLRRGPWCDLLNIHKLASSFSKFGSLLSSMRWPTTTTLSELHDNGLHLVTTRREVLRRGPPVPERHGNTYGESQPQGGAISSSQSLCLRPSVGVEQYEYVGFPLIPSCTVNPSHPRNHATTPSRDVAESLAARVSPTAIAVRLDRRAESEDIGYGRMA
jgi:hypothetical protein